MKQIIKALLVLLLSLAGTARAQFRFLPDIEYQSAFGHEIRTSWGWPYSVAPVMVNEWGDMASRSASNPYSDDYDFKSMVDVVKIGVNHDILDIVPAYKYRISLRIDYNIATPLSGGFRSMSEGIELSLSYDPDSLQQYNDLSVYRFYGAGEFTATITNVELVDPKSGALSPVAPSDIATNFFVKTEIHAQRYDRKPMFLLADACSLSADGRNLDVSCYFHTSSTGDAASGTTAYKPAAYELEWTYVDDYKCNPATGEITYGFTSDPATGVQYDFRKNSTRVQLDKPSFSIPLVYEHGAIVYRFRSVRPAFSDYADIQYSVWTLADNGTLSISDPAFAKKAGLVAQPHTGDRLNWQYTINFAEQGKYKHVVNYFDGALKDRQTQTKINSDEEYIVAVDKVYDYEGRPSLVSLPTPLAQQGLDYRSDILTNQSSGLPYKAGDFDLLGCSRPGPLERLGDDAAANIYYSPLNPDQLGMQQFVPDAEGYPLVQTVYSPDNTNKVEWQGGAGKEQQLSEGHGTRYEYVRATQSDLDRFLGTEAGYARFYPRQIVTDPNGQSSYSIMNPQGKVVISGLQSAAPDPEVKPIEPLPDFVPGREVCLDLLKNAEQDKLKNGLEFYTSFYNDGAGANTLTYSVKIKPFNTGCGSKTLWMRGFYDLNVTDDCGREYTALSTGGEIKVALLPNGNFIGNPGHPMYPGLDNPYKKVSRSHSSVPQGKILVDKKVTFSEHEADSLVRRFIKSSEPTCFKPEENFIRTAVESTEFPCAKGTDPDRQPTSCDGIRELMIAELFPDAKYGKYRYAGMNRRFGGQQPNSIFSIVEEVDPRATGGRINGRTSPCDIRGCVNHGSCDDGGREGCACTEKHMYPARCCDECVLKECACISFPIVVTSGTAITGEVEKVCENLPATKTYYHWGGSMVDDFPSPHNRGSVTRELYTEDASGAAVIYPYGTYYYHYRAEVFTCNCGKEEDIIWRRYYTRYPPDLSAYGLVYGPTLLVEVENPRPVRSGSHTCKFDIVSPKETSESAVKAYYRYQSDCIMYPDVVFGGKRYTSADIKKLEPQAFMDMFSREIAEALLPLHPEYCKLLNCEAGSTTFEETFAGLETYQEAEAAGLFSLDDIAAKDPFPAWVASRNGDAPGDPHRDVLKYPYQLETAQLGSYAAPINLPLDKEKLDIQVLAGLYCGTGNNEAMQNCAELQYRSEVFDTPPALIADPLLKQRYFSRLQARYLANRSMVRQMFMDFQNSRGGCETCPRQRMSLIDKPLFRGFLNYIFDAEGNVVRIDEDKNFATLPQWKKDLYLGNTSTIPAEFFDQYNTQKDKAAQAEAEAIMQALRECPIADRTALLEQLKAKIKAGVPITPAIIRESIVATAAGGPAALNDLCNPFLVAYGLFPDEQEAKTETANFACGDPALFTGLRDFFNRMEIRNLLAAAPSDRIAGASATISVTRGGAFTGNAFEKKFMDYFGYPTPAAATNYSINVGAIIKKVRPRYTADDLYYVELSINSGRSAQSLTLSIQAADRPHLEGNNLASVMEGGPSAAFLDPRCLNEERNAANYGLLTQKAAVIGLTGPAVSSARYFVWNDQVDFMSPVADQSALSAAINCRDIQQALTVFSGADKALYAYSSNLGHPHYEKVLTNYLNHTFNRKFSYDRYRDLMEGCALGDRMALPREIAARIEFSSDIDADAFAVQLNALGTFRPRLFRYKPFGTGRPLVLVDLSPVSDSEIPVYIKYLGGTDGSLPAITGVYSRRLHYVPAKNMLFTADGCSFSASVFPAGAATYAATPVQVWEDETYRAYTLHEFSSSAAAPGPVQQAELIAAADNYRQGADACKASYAFYNTGKLRSADYGTPFKQAYLAYINSLGAISRSDYLAAIDPATLAAALSGYTGRSFSYRSPFCAGLREHLYTYEPNPAAAEAPGYDLVKNTIISNVVAGGGKLFPDADITYKATAPAGFDEQLAIIRKANGNYWYRWFDNTSYKMYNLYIAPPAQKMARALQDYNFSAIEMGPDPNTFLVTVEAPAVPASGSRPALPAVTLKCLGYADFSLAGTSLAAANVLLHQDNGVLRCFDSLDCEKNLLAAAVLNGKAAYYQYFEANVAAYTANLLNHLVSTTKDTLIYCGRQQQYQQTLYYYDRAGNLTRTVPPEGVVSLFGGPGPGIGTWGDYMYGTDDVEPYRDDPAAYPADGYIHENPKLTRHKKVSAYKYNSLNQLVWQQTPDEGVTTFFYDAAGRQIFSQSSRQRVEGYYTYSLYDEQGRPEETGEIKLADFKEPAEDPDNTPYIISYRTRDFDVVSYEAMHPDFIANSSDGKTYSYEDLKYFIRTKSRRSVVHTAYDEMTEDLGAISDEMLSTQENLRGRVAAIRYYESVGPDWYRSARFPFFATFYSYDLGGNVKTITYDFPRLESQYKSRYKRVDYDYDLVSGKVNMISCNRGHPDQFFQRYDYDADNRITAVQTGSDGLIWNNDARYEYYKHGPLAKLQLGEHQVQSLEYAYTIQGWLKAINGDVLNPAKDMGQNGLSNDATYPRDVVAHALRYFSNDYKPVGTRPATHVAEATAKNLYNGNITQQTTGIGGLGTLQRVYSYDQLQRLRLATNTRVDDNALAAVPTPADLYKSAYSYDKDGNIRALQRWDGDETAPLQIDNFTYAYEGFGTADYGRNNRLQQVEDAAAASAGDDLQPGQPADNYSYDRSGNLLRDKQGAEHISWDRFGKVQSISDTVSRRSTTFAYDGRGNRIFKELALPLPSSGGHDRVGEYYVRDAGGNILAVYRFHSIYDLLKSYIAVTLEAAAIPSEIDGKGTVLTDVLAGYTATELPGMMRGLLLDNYGEWVNEYTDRPLDFYWEADPTLRSSLLYSGSAWIDALREENPKLYGNALLEAGAEVQPLFFSALGLPAEGRSLLRHFSARMPEEVCRPIWEAAWAQYSPGDVDANAASLYNSIEQQPELKAPLVGQMTEVVTQNYLEGRSESADFYSALVQDSDLWTSPPLREQNGPWTAGITGIMNKHADGFGLLGFFESWSESAAALQEATVSPAYRLGMVYEADPATAIRDMALTLTAEELGGLLSNTQSITFSAYVSALVAAGADNAKLDELKGYASSGDTLSLAEHHIYGSSRLGVQRYDTLTLANIANLPEEEAGNQRSTLRNRVPWYSYDFADLVDSTQRSPWAPGLTGNAYTGISCTNRTLGRRYYELSDHLGNVLATVLDRKTGVIASGSEAIYDHWHADIAQASDYYPGGMMMPGRYKEYDWSRMGFGSEVKDDEIYGKGNFASYLDRGLDTRRIQWISPDPKYKIYPYHSPYSAFAGNPIYYMDEKGQTLKVAGTAGTLNNTIARNDIYSILPEDNKYKSAVAMNKSGDVFLWSKEFLLSSNDPGGELVANLVMAKEHYVYEVTETAKYRYSNNQMEDGYKPGMLEKGSGTDNLQAGEFNNQLVNASKQPFGGPNKKYEIPLDPNVDGHLMMAPVTDLIRKTSNPDVAKPRAALVLHELGENYNRTTLKMPYHGKVGIGAHKTSISQEYKLNLNSLRRDLGNEGGGTKEKK